MTAALERLAAAGWELPAPPRPAGDYRPAMIGAGLAFTAGQLPRVDGVLAHHGRIGAEMTEGEARAAVETATLNALAALAAVTEDLEKVACVLHLRGFLRAEEAFEGHARVMDAASAIVAAAFPGGHARTVVGVASLPSGSPVEVEIVAALDV